MNFRKLGEALGIAAVSAVIVIVGMTLASRLKENQARREAAEFNAQILNSVQTRKLVVMEVTANILGGATKQDLVGNVSELWFFSRSGFDYSVDLKLLKDGDLRYDAASDVLKVHIPKIAVKSYLTGPRKRIASLALLATEGGAGNELETVAARSLEKNAQREAMRDDLVGAAVKAAKFEVGKLYEDAFRGAGQKTRVIVVANGEPW